jgi:hypothetical protein
MHVVYNIYVTSVNLKKCIEFYDKSSDPDPYPAYSDAYGFLWLTRHHPMVQICFQRYLAFDAFVKFNISNNFKQNIDDTNNQKSIRNSIPAYGF